MVFIMGAIYSGLYVAPECKMNPNYPFGPGTGHLTGSTSFM